jgi:hypothetical protein
MQFNILGLKGLIATGYIQGNGSLTNDLFSDLEMKKTNPAKTSYYLNIKSVSPKLSNIFTENANKKVSNWDLLKMLKKEGLIKELQGDGDFRSDECIKLLKQSDIVITNPPFSLFREYMEQLFKYNKKFLIIGNLNAITYKEVFKHIKDNELWLGFNNNKTVEFGLSPYYAKYSRLDEKGIKYGKVPSVSWFTNLEISKRNEPLILYKKYYGEGEEAERNRNNPNYSNPDYPKYDNYDAIEVSKVVDIPVDYYGVMGVPITFLDKYSPKQYEVVKFRKGDDEKDLTYKEPIRERERETNPTILQDTYSSSLVQTEELTKMYTEYTGGEQYFREERHLNESSLGKFEILGSSDRGGDDYEEIEKIRLTEKKEDSARIAGGGVWRKVYKRIFIRHRRT